MCRFDHKAASLGVVVSLLALAPTIVRAQSLASLSTGTRIRIDLPTADRSRFHRERMQSVVGTLETARADTLLLVVRSGADPLRIPHAAVRKLYVSGGRPPRWRAALDGALLPALITATLSAAAGSIHRKEGDPSPGQMAVSSAAWAAASGALLGAWSPKERWRPISRPDSITNSATRTRN
jgi:hypothetical protein